jgi:predicted nuclease with TOPRIM domain
MWDWAVWGALIAAAIALAAAVVSAVVRTLQGWRDLKRTRRHLFRALEELAAKGEETAEKAASLEDTEELDASLARLRRSLARAAVLRQAATEAEETFGRFAAVMPRK